MIEREPEENVVAEEPPAAKRAKPKPTLVPTQPRRSSRTSPRHHNTQRYIELSTTSDNDYMLATVFYPAKSKRQPEPDWPAVFGASYRYFYDFERVAVTKTGPQKYWFRLSEEGLRHFKNSRKAAISELGHFVHF